jgi:antitoxin (DNA-binding transcriptional repressor) of toxin-antitoxin stability system
MTRSIEMPDQVSKSQFKARALELFRQVESSGTPVIVTDHGKPAIEVRKFRNRTRAPLDILRGSVIEYERPTDPVADHDWESLR